MGNHQNPFTLFYCSSGEYLRKSLTVITSSWSSMVNAFEAPSLRPIYQDEATHAVINNI